MKTIKMKIALSLLAILSPVTLALCEPIINGQPANQPVILGTSVTFQITASGTPPLAYQWRFNDADIPDGTTANLSLTAVQLTNVGNYTVAVSDSSGSVTSQVARLDIIPTFTKATVDGGNYFGGAAWIDYDGDGFLDLAIPNGVGTSGGHNALYRNNGDGTFAQINAGSLTTDTGYSLSVAAGDYDNDGFPDVFFGQDFGPTPQVTSSLYHNHGDGTFDRITTGGPVTVTGNFVAVWADYDNDGFLDIFLSNGRGGTNFLFHNNGDGSFSAVETSMSPPHPWLGFLANTASWADYDNDGYRDLFLTGGSGNNALFHNNGNGTFTQVHGAPFDIDAGPSSGAAWGDYDNDGFLDLFVVNGAFDGVLRRNFLYHNNGDGTFIKVTAGDVATNATLSILAAWEDFDNDGNLDLFVSQNSGSANVRHNLLYHNNGDGTFTLVSGNPIVADTDNFASVAWGDYDNDGFPDLFVAAGQPSLLYHNEGGNGNHWITLKLAGTVSNRSAIGAKVRVKASIRGKSYWQMREITNGDGLSGNSLNPHFGLGDATNVDTVRIEWPSKTVQEFHNVAANQILNITEPSRLLAFTSNSLPQFILKGGRNFTYDIETASDLINWSALGTVTITNLDGTIRLMDTNAPSLSPRFYRTISR